MINIVRNNNSIVITSDYPHAFPFQNGQLTVPVNSITYTLDKSDYIAFKSAANNDVLFTGTIGEIQIEGVVVTRDEFVTSFNAVAFASVGGGGGGAIDVDNALSTTSTNPVQNKVITRELNNTLKKDGTELNFVATQISELNNRVSDLESSGGGGSIDPEIEGIAKSAVQKVTHSSTIDASNINYTLEFYDSNNTKVDAETITIGLVSDDFAGLVSPTQKKKIDGAVGQIRLTQAEYDAIAEEDRDPDVIYVITDAPNYIDEDELEAAFKDREWVGTQGEYDALGDYSETITYYIIEE